MTQFFALLERQARADEVMDLRAGIVAATIANLMGGGQRAWEASDFRVTGHYNDATGSLSRSGVVDDLPLETPPETMDIIAAINAAWGGIDLRKVK